MASISNKKLTTSSGEHLEDISHAHIVCLLYKRRTSISGSDDFSIGSDRDCVRRQQQLTKIKNIKDKYHLRFMLEDVFGLAEHQEKLR